ncbi:MAG: relaxase/mobilization nuclease domain-containing protein [Pseudomonadota bacterium]
MIPRVGPGGASFQGAGLYYLHDKDALTSERVAFTHTLNVHTDNPDRALKAMAWTAMHQAELKRSAGVAATGRKLEKPVYTYSLAWAQDERPSRDEMIAAAQDSLKAIGMDDRQAVLVSHRDTEHPHIHVILNRVHPDNGRAASTSKDHLKLSKWAEAYERGHGGIRCHARVNHNARRERGQFVKNANLTRQEYEWVKQHRTADPEAVRAARAERQAKDGDELKRDHIRRSAALEAALKRDYGKPRAQLSSEIATTEARIGTPGFFRAIARKISGAEKRDLRTLGQLKDSLGEIDRAVERRRDTLKQAYARDWEKMERRHASERSRDEQLIERRRTEGDRSRAGERARKIFRVRADSDTAGMAPALSDKEKAARALARSARKPQGDGAEGKKPKLSENALERVKDRAETIKRRRHRPRNKDKGKDFERD